MSLSRRFSLAFILLILVSILSYISFTYFNPRLSKEAEKSVQGSTVSKNFLDFLPVLDSAEEISSNSTSDGFERSLLIEEECGDLPQRFYTNVLRENGWDLEKTEVDEGFEANTFSKAGQRITVSILDNPEKSECLINLVGTRAN